MLKPWASAVTPSKGFPRNPTSGDITHFEQHNPHSFSLQSLLGSTFNHFLIEKILSRDVIPQQNMRRNGA